MINSLPKAYTLIKHETSPIVIGIPAQRTLLFPLPSPYTSLSAPPLTLDSYKRRPCIHALHHQTTTVKLLFSWITSDFTNQWHLKIEDDRANVPKVYLCWVGPRKLCGQLWLHLGFMWLTSMPRTCTWKMLTFSWLDRSVFNKESNGVWIFWSITKLWQDYEGQTQVK